MARRLNERQVEVQQEFETRITKRFRTMVETFKAQYQNDYANLQIDWMNASIKLHNNGQGDSFAEGYLSLQDLINDDLPEIDTKLRGLVTELRKTISSPDQHKQQVESKALTPEELRLRIEERRRLKPPE
jgi:dynactin complex subunit